MSSNKKNIENEFIENIKNLLQNFVKDVVDDNDFIKMYITKNKFLDIIKNIISLKILQLEEKIEKFTNYYQMKNNIEYNSNSIPLINNTKRNDYKILYRELQNVTKSRDIYMNYKEYTNNLKKRNHEEKIKMIRNNKK